MDISYTGYPVFKGLQKPLEFMGIRGKFLIYAAAIVGLSFITFIIVAFLTNKLYGFLARLVVAGGGYLLIFFKQKEGLHSKHKFRGVVVYKDLFIKEY